MLVQYWHNTGTIKFKIGLNISLAKIISVDFIE